MDEQEEDFETIITRSVDVLYEEIVERINDVRERKNRGALLIDLIEPLDESETPDRGDVIEVVADNGKLKHAEVISADRMMAYHPEFGPVPCVNILAEVIDPDRMTRDDFESLYGEEDSQAETEALGPICECGEERAGCQQNQELFGVHANSDYEDE
jgi:hypothetical protein